MKKLLKTNTVEIDKVFYAFIIWNFINFVSHIFSFYCPFMSQGIDYVFYGVEIVLFLYLIIRIRISHCDKIYVFSTFISWTIILDVIELWFVIFAVDTSHHTFLSLFFKLTFIVRFVIEYLAVYCFSDFMYGEANTRKLSYRFYFRFKKFKDIWMIFNVLFLILLVVFWFRLNKNTLTLVYLFILVRFILGIAIIYNSRSLVGVLGPVDSDDYFVGKYSFFDIVNKHCKAFYILRMIIGIGLIVFAIFILIKKNQFDSNLNFLADHPSDIVDRFGEAYSIVQQSEDVYTYKVHNNMPVNSCFYDEKYGIINIKTNYNSGPVYDECPMFDSDGISPDYKGHMIDLDGNVVFDIPSFVTRKKSVRQRILDNDLADIYDKNILFENSLDNGSFSTSGFNDHFWEYDGLILCYEFNNRDFNRRYDRDYERHYFDKGIAVYYSEVNNCFGIITEDGNRLIDPIFEKISFENGYGLIGVYQKKNGYNVIDSNGEFLIPSTSYDYVNIKKMYPDKGTAFFIDSADSDINDSCLYVVDADDDYQYIDSYIYEGDYNYKYWRLLLKQDVFVLTRTSGRNLQVVFSDGEIVLESNEYKKISVVEPFIENYIFACQKQDGFINIIDVNEKVLIPGNYSDYAYIGDGRFYLKSADKEHFDEAIIADINGNITYTGFEFVSADEEKEDGKNTNLKVSKNIGSDSYLIVYNYIDSNGEIIDDWHINKGEYTNYDLTYHYEVKVDDNNEKRLHWYDKSDNYIFSEYIPSGTTEDVDFGIEFLDKDENIEQYGPAFFWIKNELGSYDLYDSKGEYIRTITDLSFVEVW
ncbi:hypothetical protein CSX00_01260 [Pseudobutyrivibrio ruminis]|uniref:WG containing repeat-containing protein n=1 Tax=Pseudobutyrivibrio ruminis TaxID=46206 RepID=A0A2G3EE36_9FIRM|nr:hypothetical protein [Pseudobutyrivibrio ruminis]PHU41520.1 hypothetical protein CSX00_01260 [Pseudobutyrivibrio ruminis]